MWPRRRLLSSMAASAVLFAMRQPPLADGMVSLSVAAKRCGIAFGTAIDSEVLDDTGYARLVLDHAATTGNINAFKYDWLRAKGPEADFSRADQILGFAEQAGLPFTATAMFWNDYPPPWLKSRSTDDLKSLFDAHADEVAARYSGRVSAWVVVNEPFSPWDLQPGVYRLGPWFSAYGPDYIARAFRRARAADPKARLILNEAFCERRDDIGGAVRPALLDLVKRLKDQDVPLDTVGLQGHLQPQHGLDHDAYVTFLLALAKEGVTLEITELDVDDSRIGGSGAVRDEAVAGHYAAFLSAVLTVPAVRSVVTWGLSDRYTWYKEVAAKENPLAPHVPRTLPFDAAGNAKPAAHAIAGVFAACAP
jgi:endo-1,4-beta-xylanase